MSLALAATVKNATMALAANASTAAAAVQGAAGARGSELLGMAQSNASALPGPAPMVFGWGSYLQAVGSVFLILGIIIFGFWALRRFGPRGILGGRGKGTLSIEAHLPVGPKKNVVVVRFLNKRLVLGVTDSQINLLTEMDTDDDDAADDFTDSLEKARNKGAS